MNSDKWLNLNAESLKGKKVAITGSTGGLGARLAEYLAKLGAELILVDRNAQKSGALRENLKAKYGTVSKTVVADLSNFSAVRAATEELKKEKIDIFIHNAGAYKIPRKITDEGFDNVFQINFLSPYYMIKELLPSLRERKGRVVAVGSIAHNYSKTDKNDVDFRNKKAPSKVYGNAKRFLMFSLFELFKSEKEVSLSVVHPGITLTNITAHYPKVIFAIIKYPMKVIFMPPEKAALSLLAGVFGKYEYLEWIGPKCFGIWGLPKKSLLKTADSEERAFIYKTAERLYGDISKIQKYS